MKKTKNILALLFGVVAIALLVWILISVFRLPQKTVSEPKTITYTPYTDQSFAMDTFVVQQVFHDDEQTAKQAMDAVNKLLTDMEAKLSMYKSTSDISKINSQAGMTEVKIYKPDREVYDIVYRATELSKTSGGAFDITIAPLTRLWGVTDVNAEKQVPSAARIQTAKNAVGCKNIVFDEKNKTVWLKKAFMGIDLGGIAKGYACDRLRTLYQQSGVDSVLTSVGGNILAIGKKPDGHDFTIGLRDPFGSETDVFATLAVRDKIVSTTGAYERYFELDGKRYHHILDPQTGYPAESDFESVTVLSEDGMYADFCSTMLYIRGMDALKETIEKGDVSVIAVDADRKVYASADIKAGLKLSDGFTWGD